MDLGLATPIPDATYLYFMYCSQWIWCSRIQCTQLNHSKVSFLCTSLVSRAPVQQQVENTAVWTMYKQCNMDRIVYGGVTVSVHEEKQYTAYSF